MKKTPQVSRRVQGVIASPIRKFLPLVLDAEKRGIKFFKLNVGDPDLPPPAVFFDTLKTYNRSKLGYAPSPGTSEHVAAWQDYYSYYNIKIEPKNILVTVGGAEAILLSMLAASDPGDEFLVFEPLYSSYKGFAAMLNVALVPITLSINNNFSLPPVAEIEKKITKKTKAIIIINPNNPTGAILSVSDLMAIGKIAKRHNLFILSDETYREIVFDGSPLTALSLAEYRDQVVVIDSVSKRYSCPGARIGCIVSFNEEFMAAVLRLAMIRLSAPTLEQFALIPILRASRQYTDEVVLEYERRRDALYQALEKIPGLTCRLPQGAFYIIVGLPLPDSEEFVKFMINDFCDNSQSVLVTPARDFYISPDLGKNEVRIAYVLNSRDIARAMEIFSKGLKAYLKKI